MGTPRKEPFAAGERLGGKYVLTRRIGSGGMGEVWAAQNEMTSAEVALKLLKPSLEHNAENMARFRHEANVGAQLDHRNIARVFDFLEEPDGTLVLVMTLLRGKSLQRYLKEKGVIVPEEAITIARGILSALEHAHDMKIIHRDIKPGNVFLSVDPDGLVTPKLLDFGIAKVPGSNVETIDGSFLGTPHYMAPERIRDKADIDHRVDIYSVGILLIEMLTGSAPFRKDSPQATLAAVLEEPLDPDPRIEPRLWLAIKRATSKVAYERHATAREFSDELRNVFGSDAKILKWEKPEPNAKPIRLAAPPSVRPQKEEAWKPAAFWLALGVLTAIVATVLFWAVGGAKPAAQESLPATAEDAGDDEIVFDQPEPPAILSAAATTQGAPPARRPPSRLKPLPTAPKKGVATSPGF